MVMWRCRAERKLEYLFTHSSTKGSTGKGERIESIRPLMISSGHLSSNNCPTTRGAFRGLTYR
jgi:hypothetical protein